MGSRGPAPKPTRLKILSGSKKPLNRREPMPQRGRPRCPTWLDPMAKSKWVTLVPALDRVGILTLIDGDALAVFCQAWAEFQWATQTIRKEGRTITLPSGHVQTHPAVAMQRSAWAAVKAFSALFGLDPSSRSRLDVGGGDGLEDDDPLQELMNRQAHAFLSSQDGKSGKKSS